MIDVSTLTIALHDKLIDSTALDLLRCERERSVRINFDPARCPWVGVYPGTVETNPRTAAGSKSWTEPVELQVVAQTASFGSDGADASDALEGLLKAIMDVMNEDLTLGITGARVVKFRREYRYVQFDDDGQGDLFMPQAVITISLEVRS
ncbi:MAG: hypothetical protein A2W25_15230 [candidate division Zixibacteria bacterium RBG_16_53_22]|nr:MAG: hypothetical protein A2W25_15230 [candidate division Zixibacteria bacterium RBG_16_53_22]